MSRWVECPHGVAREWCAICKGSPAIRELGAEPRRMRARYSSRCPECGDWIEEGDEIHMGGEGRWVCASC